MNHFFYNARGNLYISNWKLGEEETVSASTTENSSIVRRLKTPLYFNRTTYFAFSMERKKKLVLSLRSLTSMSRGNDRFGSSGTPRFFFFFHKNFLGRIGTNTRNKFTSTKRRQRMNAESVRLISYRMPRNFFKAARSSFLLVLARG